MRPVAVFCSCVALSPVQYRGVRVPSFWSCVSWLNFYPILCQILSQYKKLSMQFTFLVHSPFFSLPEFCPPAPSAPPCVTRPSRYLLHVVISFLPTLMNWPGCSLQHILKYQSAQPPHFHCVSLKSFQCVWR